jgi:heme/copper-type cytochrome/quinol oxidase subunit 2
MKPHRGAVILVLGILGLIVCAPLGIAAWVMGSGDMKEMDAGTMDPSGRGNTEAGKICGMIGTILMIVSIIIVFIVGILFLALVVFGAAASHQAHPFLPIR